MVKLDKPTDFLFCQIIQRKKEHPELGSNNRVIKTYYIYSNNDLLNKYKPEIIKLCEAFNARAYIHLVPRDSNRLALETLRSTAEKIANGQQRDVKNVYNTVCGQYPSKDYEKLWIVDIDTKDINVLNQIEFDISQIEPIGGKTKGVIPTKSGFHLITKPFNSQIFGMRHPEIEIHKNNPSLLFIP